MTRTEQLRTCRKCCHINFDTRKGFICSLTANYATFTHKCINFNEATFVSKKKILKPSKLQLIEKVKARAKKGAIKRMMLIFTLVFLGCLMLDDPYLFSPDFGGRFSVRKALDLLWGVPSGLFFLGLGFYLAFQMLMKR